ncbi:uncharacterized protein LOC113317902 [Papaver somniferum]|uniref:uncharacterized protein LOC113317902 n=1 Tax=Papaver somniferum TaxID=3469 RepID=UPI000E6F9D42|nr:uncharacterized protein LOC113317902 [Papaver somniferum]
MRMWLCFPCFLWFSWKRPCRGHPGGILNGPFNGRSADFLIFGLDKPTSPTLFIDNRSADTVPVDEFAGLSIETLHLLFQKQITTTSSIPTQCRFNFSRTLKSALDKVLAHPTELGPWLQLLLLPICTLSLYMPKNAIEEWSGARKKIQTCTINRALDKWKEPQGCTSLIQKILEVNNELQQSRKDSKKKRKTNAQACKKKISQGHYAAATRILSSNGVALDTADTLAELRQKHPYAPPLVIPSTAVEATPISVDSHVVLSAIRSFPKGTSWGKDGLRAQHLLDAFSGSAAAVSDEFFMSTSGVVNLWLSGQCPPSLGEYIASAPLTPLLKPYGGLRPIAIGTIWRQLCSKLATTTVCKDMVSYLGDHQFGVGIPYGGEIILHSANRLHELKDRLSSMKFVPDAQAYHAGLNSSMHNPQGCITVRPSYPRLKVYNKGIC